MNEKLNRLNDVFFKYLLGDIKKKSLTLSFTNGIYLDTSMQRPEYDEVFPVLLVENVRR